MPIWGPAGKRRSCKSCLDPNGRDPQRAEKLALKRFDRNINSGANHHAFSHGTNDPEGADDAKLLQRMGPGERSDNQEHSDNDWSQKRYAFRRAVHRGLPAEQECDNRGCKWYGHRVTA